MDFTGHKEMLREVLFSCDLVTLRSVLKTGKAAWESLNPGDMEELKKIHIGMDEYFMAYYDRGVYEIRKDTGWMHGIARIQQGDYDYVFTYRSGMRHGPSMQFYRKMIQAEGNWYKNHKHGKFVSYINLLIIEDHYRFGRLYERRMRGSEGLYKETFYEGKSTLIKEYEKDVLVSERRYLRGSLHGWQINYRTGKRRLYRKGKFRTSKPLKMNSS